MYINYKAFQLFANKKTKRINWEAPHVRRHVTRNPKGTLSVARVRNVHVSVIRLDHYTKSNPCAFH